MLRNIYLRPTPTYHKTMTNKNCFLDWFQFLYLQSFKRMVGRFWSLKITFHVYAVTIDIVIKIDGGWRIKCDNERKSFIKAIRLEQFIYIYLKFDLLTSDFIFLSNLFSFHFNSILLFQTNRSIAEENDSKLHSSAQVCVKLNVTVNKITTSSWVFLFHRSNQPYIATSYSDFCYRHRSLRYRCLYFFACHCLNFIVQTEILSI